VTSTVTPTHSYPVKQVLLDYTVGGFHTPFEMYYADYGMDGWSELILYTDGQLIIPGIPYQQKILSKDEIDQLLSKLESLGFYTIESNQRHDLSDKLYNFGNQYQGVSDPEWYCVLINKDESRKLCEWEPYKKFLVPEMKNILNFLDGYKIKGMSPYVPDRILLRVLAGRNAYDDHLSKEAIPWTETSLSLETTSEKIMYAEDGMAKRLFAQLGNGTGVVVTQGDVEYTVYIEIVLPHKEVTNP
jgi:hypothetical protein